MRTLPAMMQNDPPLVLQPPTGLWVVEHWRLLGVLMLAHTDKQNRQHDCFCFLLPFIATSKTTTYQLSTPHCNITGC